MLNSPAQILFYTRPWEVHFHLELARQLACYFPESPIRFVTFFEWAARRARSAGYDVIYLPERLRACNLTLGDDEVLREIDKQLQAHDKIGLNLMSHSERFLPHDGDAALEFIYRHTTVLDNLICPETLSISAMYDHFVYWLAGSLANMRNGWHFAFVCAALPGGRVMALSTPWKAWEADQEEDIDLETARRSMDQPVEQRIEYMRESSRPPLVRRLKHRFEYQLCNKYDAYAGSYFANFSWWSFFFGSARTFTLRKLQRPHYEIETEEDLHSWNAETPFFYIPLHMEPEATILMYSPWLRDQLEMCRLCSQALPIGLHLLIKENPKMNLRRQEYFYENLRRLPGVMLVAPEVSSPELIRRSKGVISLAGSACLEASILGKPSLVFGRPPFRSMIGASDYAVAESFTLEGLTAWMRNPRPIDEKILEEEWRKWLLGTFVASSTPRPAENGLYEVDSSTANVEAYCMYINRVIKDGANSPGGFIHEHSNSERRDAIS